MADGFQEGFLKRAATKGTIPATPKMERALAAAKQEEAGMGARSRIANGKTYGSIGVGTVVHTEQGTKRRTRVTANVREMAQGAPYAEPSEPLDIRRNALPKDMRSVMKGKWKQDSVRSKEAIGKVTQAARAAMQAETRAHESAHARKKLVLGDEAPQEAAVVYKTKKANFADAEPSVRVADVPTITPLDPNSLAKASMAREASAAKLRANNEARKKKLENANREHAEGMNVVAGEQLAEVEAASELERMRTEAAANEPEPNSERERLDKLKAIMQKYGRSDYQVARSTFTSKVEGLDRPSTVTELDPHHETYEPSIPLRMNRLYAGEQYAAPAPVLVPAAEASVPAELSETAFRDYHAAMSKALDTAPEVQLPEQKPMSPEEVAALSQEAARLYQGGQAFDIVPAPETMEERMEAAARIYQGGENLVPSSVSLEASNESASIPEDAPESSRMDAPVVMLNPILSRQAGLKDVRPPSFRNQPLPPHLAELIRQEGEKKVRARNERKGKGIWGAITAGGTLGALLAFMHVGESQKQVPHKTAEKAAATRILQGFGAYARSSVDAPPTIVIPHKAIEASIDTRGEGADTLYTKLALKLRAEYPDQDAAPALVQKLLAYPNADAFSREMGFEKLEKGKPTKSAALRMVDSFKLSADGKTLAYVDSSGAPFVIMQTTPQGNVFDYQPQNLKMRAYGAGTPVHIDRERSSPVPPASTPVPTPDGLH